MKYFEIEDTKRIFAYASPVDIRRGFPGLAKMIREDLKRNPAAGDLFLFVNEKRTYLKILSHSKGGFCIFMKKLDSGTFRKVKGKVLDTDTLMDLINGVITVTEGKLDKQQQEQLSL